MYTLSRFTKTCMSVSLENELDVYFSFLRPIAFRTPAGLTVTENIFGGETSDDIHAITYGREHKWVPAGAFNYTLERNYRKSLVSVARDLITKTLRGECQFDPMEENRCQRLLKDLGRQQQLPGLS